MLRTAGVQMKEATCSLPFFLHFLLTTIIYTFSQTYKQPPIRPTLTHSACTLHTHVHTHMCTHTVTSHLVGTRVDALCFLHEEDRGREEAEDREGERESLWKRYV